jgi:iron complex outermembrane receptor protein
MANTWYKRTLLLAPLAATALSTPLLAQELEEVIVTAERRSQSIQDVPLSVSAISGEDVAPGKIVNLDDVAYKTPSVVFTRFNVGEPRIYVRGIGSSSDSAASDPAVGIFVDEVYIGRTGGVSFDLYDLERIEILRGPQGTLYGKNTNGGAINIVSSRPSQDFNAKLGLTAGNYNLWGVRGLVNGGLTDTLAGKLSFSTMSRDGFGENVITPEQVVTNGNFSNSPLIGGSIGAANGGDNLDDAENISVRGQVLYEPTERLSVLLGADYAKDKTNGICRHLQNLEEGGATAALWASELSDKYNDDDRNCATQFETEQEREVTGLLARVDYDLDWGTFTSITAWRSSAYDYTDDLTGVPLMDPNGFITTPENVVNAVDEEASQISQEFRLSGSSQRLDWLAGAFLMREEVDRKEEYYTQYSALIRTQLPLAGVGDVLFTQDNTTTSTALFGQLDWHITDQWTLTYGVRWSLDEKDIEQGSIDLIGGNIPPTGVPLILPGFGPVSAKDDWSQVTNKLSTSYQFNDNVMAYLLYSEGFKSGAFESQTNTVAAAVTPVDPEFVRNYEAGVKTNWWSNRMQFNLTYFYMDYEDLQVFQLNSQLLLRLLNAQAESRGWEANFTILPIDNLMLSLEYSNNDAKYTEFTDANGRDLEGNDLVNAPAQSLVAAADYTQPLAGGSSLNFNVSYNWKDEYFSNPANAEKTRQPAAGIVDANMSWASADQSWVVTAWGKNLTDEQIIASLIVDPTGITSEAYKAPRTYGLTVTKNW